MPWNMVAPRDRFLRRTVPRARTLRGVWAALGFSRTSPIADGRDFKNSTSSTAPTTTRAANSGQLGMLCIALLPSQAFSPPRQAAFRSGRLSLHGRHLLPVSVRGVGRGISKTGYAGGWGDVKAHELRDDRVRSPPGFPLFL